MNHGVNERDFVGSKNKNAQVAYRKKNSLSFLLSASYKFSLITKSCQKY